MEKDSIENRVQYGLDSIDETITIEVNLKRILLIYKTMEELISFFHQPDHYQSISDIHQYMGNKKAGMYSLLHKIYYNEFDKILPENIKTIVEGDDLQSPDLQYYKTN